VCSFSLLSILLLFAMFLSAWFCSAELGLGVLVELNLEGLPLSTGRAGASEAILDPLFPGVSLLWLLHGGRRHVSVSPVART
jgi:hypothetical protein